MKNVINRIKASCILSLGLISLYLTLLLLTDHTFLKHLKTSTFFALAFLGFFVFSHTLAGFIDQLKKSNLKE